MSQENVERWREGVCEALRELVLAPALRSAFLDDSQTHSCSSQLRG